MKILNLIESEILSAYASRLTLRDECLTMPEDYVPTAIRLCVETLARCAGERKDKETPVCVAIDGLDGEFILGCFVQYIKEESDKEDSEEQTSGSWRCEFVFNKEKLPEGAKVLNASDGICDTEFKKVAYSYKARLANSNIAYVLMEVFASTLKEFLLNVLVTKEEPVEIEFNEVFTAGVQIDENDEKELYFTPDGSTIKKSIKSDIDLVE